MGTVTRSTGPVDSDFVEGRICDWHLEVFNPSNTENRQVIFTVWDLDATPAAPFATRSLILPPRKYAFLTIPIGHLEHTMAVEEDDGVIGDPLLVTIYGRDYWHRNIAGATYRNSELSTFCSLRVFWYMSHDPNHFTGGLAPVPPTPSLTSFYDTTVEAANVLNNPPSGYDVLMLSDTGAKFDVSAFTGKVIVTLDSGISPLMYWFTGDINYGNYWDYNTEEVLHWVTPAAPDEVGAGGDARIYSTLAPVPGFIRRNDLMEAYSTTKGYDDIVIYEITKGGRSFFWVHFGPHFGNYDLTYTAERLSELMRFALDLLCGKHPSFPPAPPLTATVLSAEKKNHNRK